MNFLSKSQKRLFWFIFFASGWLIGADLSGPSFSQVYSYTGTSSALTSTDLTSLSPTDWVLFGGGTGAPAVNSRFNTQASGGDLIAMTNASIEDLNNGAVRVESLFTYSDGASPLASTTSQATRHFGFYKAGTSGGNNLGGLDTLDTHTMTFTFKPVAAGIQHTAYLWVWLGGTYTAYETRFTTSLNGVTTNLLNNTGVSPGQYLYRINFTPNNKTDKLTVVFSANDPTSSTVAKTFGVHAAALTHAALPLTDANAPTYTWSLLAGQTGGKGNADGFSTTARFNFPRGMTCDAVGNVYVADFDNQTIRKISPSGSVVTLAGMAGQVGSRDGTGTNARFYQPSGLAVDTGGNVYVADTNNQLIRKITSTGVVTTLAGTANTIGRADGSGTSASFYFPEALTVDSSGNVYVSDKYNHSIRQISPSGVVSTFVGSLSGQSGSSDGTGNSALFAYPSGISVNKAGTILYVCDSGNHTIRKVDITKKIVTTLAGSAGISDNLDGTGSAARFYYPEGMSQDKDGNLYIADNWNHTIRKVTPAGVVSTVAGANGEFDAIAGVAVDASNHLFVSDNHQIWSVTGAVATVFVGGKQSNGYADGAGAAAQFYHPQGITLDSTGNLYVADTRNQLIRKVTADGVVTTISGIKPIAPNTTPLTATYIADSPAQYQFPTALALKNNTTLYVVDSFYNRIRKITISTGIGAGWFGPASAIYHEGFADGASNIGTYSNGTLVPPYPGLMARPQGMAVDSNNNLFVADWGNHAIRKISTTGAISTVAGAAPDSSAKGFPKEVYGTSGSSDGSGTDSRFKNPEGLAFDSAGNLFITDTWNQTIRKMTPEGVVTTFAGRAGVIGSADGLGRDARFNRPSGISIDANNNLYITDCGNHLIRRITPDGTVTTLGGSPGVIGSVVGVGNSARFAAPYGIAVSKSLDANGNPPLLYVADSENNRIVQGTLLSAPVNPYLQWQNKVFTASDLTNSSISGELADPDHDGLNNLMEYAMALDPKSLDASGAPDLNSLGDYLTLTYRQNKEATDLIYTVEACSSLSAQDWTAATTELSRVDHGTYWAVTVQDNATISSSKTRFMRLKVKKS